MIGYCECGQVVDEDGGCPNKCKTKEIVKTAYLVGFIDTKADPPTFRGAAIFSEPGPTVSGYPFVIIEASDKSFGAAVEALKRDVRGQPFYRWAERYLDDR